jgi:hypothetical protein
MDAPELRQRLGQFVETFAAHLGELVALVNEYDAELVPVPPPPPAEILVQPDASLQAVITAAPDGAVLNLQEQAFTGPVTLSRPVTLRNGAIVAPPNCNDVVNVTGPDVALVDLTIRGDGTTKRGVAANGIGLLMLRCQVLNICRVGQESQAVASWNGGNITLRECHLEAGSIFMLLGGSSPTIPNHVVHDVLVENCTMSRPEAWRTLGYACKTGFEVKSGRRITVRGCSISNVWLEAQTAWAFTFTPSQYGNSPENIVEDVLVEGCVITNVGGGVNALGFSQSQSTYPTLRSQNIRFVNTDFTISREWARRGTSIPHGSLTQLGGGGPLNMLWAGCTVIQDGDAFLRTSGTDPIANFAMSSCTIAPVGTYGIWTPVGSRGGAWVATAFPGIGIEDNEFHAAHSTFRTQFPDNTYL